MNVDGKPVKAEVTTSASRDFVEISIDPKDATLGGETLGTLWFRVDLTRTADCSSNCAPINLDGQTTTGNLVYGVLTYNVEAQPTPNEACPLTQVGDPLQLQRGAIAGSFRFDHLDHESGELNIWLLPQFGVGFPFPGVAHQVAIGPIEATFGHNP